MPRGSSCLHPRGRMLPDHEMPQGCMSRESPRSDAPDTGLGCGVKWVLSGLRVSGRLCCARPGVWFPVLGLVHNYIPSQQPPRPRGPRLAWRKGATRHSARLLPRLLPGCVRESLACALLCANPPPPLHLRVLCGTFAPRSSSAASNKILSLR